MNQFYPKKALLTEPQWLARNIFLASILVLVGISVAHAVPKIWSLDEVQFNSDTTAVGLFVYHADTKIYSNINLTKIINTNTYVVIKQSEANKNLEMSVLQQFLPDLTDQPRLKLQFESALTNVGGSVNIEPLPMMKSEIFARRSTSILFNQGVSTWNL